LKEDNESIEPALQNESSEEGKEVNGQEQTTIQPTEGAEAPDKDLAAEVAFLNDQLLRALAEFENYKKRMQREIAGITQNASEKLIMELLPVVDDMERALKVARELAPEDPKMQQFVQGFEIIYGKMMKVLEGRGLKAMDSIGKPLDANLHDALMVIEVPEAAPHTVVDEHEKGYFLNDRVIRHAKVIVSR
jgi:molecular chaperone GrpE